MSRPWRAGFSPWHSMIARGWDWHDPFPAWLTALRSETRSGVYVFRHVRTKAVLYVGESHSGALYSTITRHFQKWHGPQAGTTYKRREVEVSVRRCASCRPRARRRRKTLSSGNCARGTTSRRTPRPRKTSRRRPSDEKLQHPFGVCYAHGRR